MRSKPSLNLPLIMMEDITKSFRQGSVESRVLLGIDLTINRGEFVVVFGPSGCGKSTLLAIMGLLDSPTGGVYCFDGQPVQNLKLSDRARIRNQEIGFVFQGFNLIGDMTVFENVEQPLAYSNMRILRPARARHGAIGDDGHRRPRSQSTWPAIGRAPATGSHRARPGL